MKPDSHDVALGPLTSFGIGGPAERYYRPRTAGDAVKALDAEWDRGRLPRILGGGTNLLVDDEGVRGAVLSLRDLRGSRRLSGHRVWAEAGLPLPALLARCWRWGLAGLEPLTGIPGTVGGAVFMNASGPGASIADRLESVDLAVPGAGVERRGREALEFGYRSSGLSGGLILGATFQLAPADPETVRGRMTELKARKAATQPVGARSAGCFFRNMGKVPVGLLLDRAGLKGTRVGGAMISPVHANFIVNLGGATARDVLRLARFARDTIEAIYGIRPRAEVRYWKSAAAVAARVPRARGVGRVGVSRDAARASGRARAVRIGGSA